MASCGLYCAGPDGFSGDLIDGPDDRLRRFRFLGHRKVNTFIRLKAPVLLAASVGRKGQGCVAGPAGSLTQQANPGR
jgi:hypothetical protein